MKALSLVCLGLLSFGVNAVPDIEPPPIYILRTDQPATNVLGKALGRLGYSRGSRRASSNTYIEVASGSELVEIAASHRDAKFILPRGGLSTGDVAPESCDSWWMGGACHDQNSTQLMTEEEHAWLARNVFSEDESSRGLELDVLALEQAAQAENWVALCKFLGMGYSMVERMSLWHFPQ
ncbi:hypothetical protein GGS26DRAFT_112556 [Hypomontagnella submonticulosa]|nr:hypothetical protein GGS26DRAFT_112556 [Hypomontagnella submonticulosa]